MPTNTFFRLPEEKRQRLIDAAWDEFSNTSFSDASINRIIQNAHIPRGSFYQYFTDKEDLFWHLLSEVQAYIADTLVVFLREERGDLFSVPVKVFDRFVGGDRMDPKFQRFVEVLRINPGLDFQRFLAGRPGTMPDWLLEQIDWTRIRGEGRELVDDIFFLNIACLAFAIMETLRQPEQRAGQREMLQRRIEIVKYGSLNAAPSPAYSE